MRATIRTLLIAGTPAVGGRVYEQHALLAADPSTIAKPFIVLKEGVNDASASGEDWGNALQPVEVWPYADQDSSYAGIDTLASQIVAALHNVRFAEGGTQYLAQYVGGDQDFWDEDWKAITRRQRFNVFALAWLSGATYSPDPVAALQTWTEAALPETQQNPATWDPQNATPGVYWRMASIAVAEEGLRAWGAWLDATSRAHVVAPAPATRVTYVRRLTERLATQRQLTLSDGSPLFFRTISADSEADAMRTGQVTLVARFGVRNPPVTPAPQVINQTNPIKLVTSYP